MSAPSGTSGRPMTAHDLSEKLEFLERSEYDYPLVCVTPHGSYQFHVANMVVDHEDKRIVLVMQQTDATEAPNESERMVSVPVPVLRALQAHFEHLTESVEELGAVANNLASGNTVHLPLEVNQ